MRLIVDRYYRGVYHVTAVHASRTRTDAAVPLAAPAGRSLWQDAFSRLRHNRAAVASGIVLGVIVLACIVVPWISPYSYYTPQWTMLDAPPTLHGGHIFGTDDLGRDLLIRVMWGCRISLMIGIVASVVSVASARTPEAAMWISGRLGSCARKSRQVSSQSVSSSKIRILCVVSIRSETIANANAGKTQDNSAFG